MCQDVYAPDSCLNCTIPHDWDIVKSTRCGCGLPTQNVYNVDEAVFEFTLCEGCKGAPFDGDLVEKKKGGLKKLLGKLKEHGKGAGKA